MPRLLLLLVMLGILPVTDYAQFIQTTTEKFTRADTLRGSLRPERNCYDVIHYNIDLELLVADKAITGFVDMRFKVKNDFNRLQIDLFDNMIIDSILLGGQKCTYTREFNAVFVDVPKQHSGTEATLRTYYQGRPVIAKNAPWDGGFVWKTDTNKNPWVAVACEGTGASLWWPCKDHPADEPDSLSFSMTVPHSLTCISNGNLIGKTPLGDGKNKFHWKVTYPINLYNVTFYAGDYYLIDDEYLDFKHRRLDIDYWTLGEKTFKAKLHFRQVDGMLHAYEHYFAPYPYFNNGFALVESPYLGMEHQSAIAYGNQYNRGYLGGRIPDDQNFDFIIIHESAHEYWGNSVTADDHADLWIHESFTTYCEALYVEWINNYKKAVDYLVYQKPYIKNLSPMVGPRDVNYNNWKDSDIYYKGSWMLHSLRNTINNDSMWFGYLKAVYTHFAGSVTNTTAVVDFTNQYFNKDLTPFFRQFLMYKELPVFEYFIDKKGKNIDLYYRWNCQVKEFDMPQKVTNGREVFRIFPTGKWQKHRLKDFSVENFKLDETSFLMGTYKVTQKPKI